MQRPIAGIILAAGASSRMGRPKWLLREGDDTFLSRITRTLAAAAAEPIVVVAGDEVDAVRAAILEAGLAAEVVHNPRREQGQLSSLLVALEALRDPRIAGALVCLVDTPLVSVETVARVMAVFRDTGAPVVRPASGTRHGHPVLFSREVFDDLHRADLAAGAKTVVRAHAASAVDVEVDDPGAFIDIDTPEDYERWIRDRG